MNDLLTLLDRAIDELVAVGSSRCSRSQVHTETGTGTVNHLETNAVPVVPVVPVPKQEARDGISQIAEIILAGNHAEQGVAHASIPLNQREQREQRELERINIEFQTLSSSRCGSDCALANGNNGNGSRNFISNGKIGLAASARDEFDLRDIFDESAAIAEFESGIPRAWAEGFARLQTMACPAGMRPDRWQEMVNDAGRFLARWGAQAAALGWSTLDVFGAHPTHPIERLDCAGLIILLHGDELLAFTADTARTRRRNGAILTYYRRPRPGAVPLWRSGSDMVDITYG